LVFSSFEFIFFFLPLLLLGHWALPGTGLKNAWLLLGSLAFFAWGEPGRAWILVAVGLWAWAWARVEASPRWGGRWALWMGIAGPLGLLLWFKYAKFFQASLLQAWPQAPLWVPRPGPALPLGISFFAFQAMAYSLDCHRRVVSPQQPWHRVLLFKALFPQLVAGPIMRYGEMERALRERSVSLAAFGRGAELFCAGLGQKVLLADQLGLVSQELYKDLPGLSTGRAWLAAVLYGLQLFLDFSGYSLMAMGLGRLLGFRFRRNFLYPYRALSITEFWRRWHITLSQWFRDYVYVPLGGNRGGTLRTLLNLWAVFLLCGFWHGAAWTFVAWGALFGLLLSAERLTPAWAAPRWLRRAYVLVAVTLAWTLFNAPDAGVFLDRLGRMLGAAHALPGGLPLAWYLPLRIWLALGLAVAVSAGAWPWLLRRLPLGGRAPLRLTLSVASLLLSLVYLAGGSQLAFLYFRF
jgi:alginate O-acetyltransferase complex protein AlgI